MDKPQLKTTNKLLKLRSTLDQLSQSSFSFSVLNKQYPIHTLSEDKAQELIVAYEEIIERVRSSLKSEYESSPTANQNMEG